MSRLTRLTCITVSALALGLLAVVLGLAAIIVSSTRVRQMPAKAVSAHLSSQPVSSLSAPRLQVLGDETLLRSFREQEARRLFTDGLTTEELADLARSENPFLRSLAVKLLRRLEGAAAIEILRMRLYDSEAGIRAQTAFALAELDAKQVLAPLAEMAKRDTDPRVRSAAVRALGKLKANGHATMLVAMLAEEKVVKCSAIESLGDLGYEEARDRIRKLFQESDTEVSLSCSYALARLGQKDMSEFLKDALRHRDESVRMAAVRLCSELGPSEMVGPIVERLSDQSERVRLAAIDAVLSLRNPQGAEPLKRIAEKDTDWTVRHRAQLAAEDIAWLVDKQRR